MLMAFYFFTDGDIISKIEGVKITEVNKTASLKWNLNGVPDGTTVYKMFYIKDERKDEILSYTPTTNTINSPLNPIVNKKIFKNRMSGNLSLTNGDGAVTFTLSDVQYDESGVFNLDIQVFTGGIQENVSSTLDVQGMY